MGFDSETYLDKTPKKEYNIAMKSKRKEGDRMNRRLKEARQQKKIKLTEIAEIIGVSQPTMSSWEAGRADPSLENLVKLAEIYGVTVDYLLGRDFGNQSEAPIKPISVSSLPIYHSRPVWIKGTGWALVNSVDGTLVFADNRTRPFSEDMELYATPPCYTQSALPDEMPLERDEIKNLESVWVEPISKDLHLRDELRGWYTVKGEYVENTRGSRFFLDSYDATWLAFANKA